MIQEAPTRRRQGIALLVVLVILLAVAEAGVHRALSVLEGTAPDGGPGRFTLTVADAADGSPPSLNGGNETSTS